MKVQTKDEDDIFDEGSEDKEIMESLKYAERQLGTKMNTPVAVKEHPWSPITYDVENSMLNYKVDHGAIASLIATGENNVNITPMSHAQAQSATE